MHCASPGVAGRGGAGKGRASYHVSRTAKPPMTFLLATAGTDVRLCRLLLQSVCRHVHAHRKVAAGMAIYFRTQSRRNLDVTQNGGPHRGCATPLSSVSVHLYADARGAFEDHDRSVTVVDTSQHVTVSASTRQQRAKLPAAQRQVSMQCNGPAVVHRRATGRRIHPRASVGSPGLSASDNRCSRAPASRYRSAWQRCRWRAAPWAYTAAV